MKKFAISILALLLAFTVCAVACTPAKTPSGNGGENNNDPCVHVWDATTGKCTVCQESCAHANVGTDGVCAICGYDTDGTGGGGSTTDGHIIINQIYGRGNNKGEEIDTATAGSHSFIELYNPTSKSVSLDGWSIQIAQGATPLNGEPGNDWKKLDLSGSIPSKTSYLIVCTKNANTEMANLKITEWDLAWDRDISNKNLKVVLVSNTTKLEVINPFDYDGNGTKVDGYVDMIGVAANDVDTPPIDGCETESFYDATKSEGVQSKHKSIRRIDFADTDNNKNDCEIVDYRAENISAEVMEKKRPRSTADGVWENEAGTKATHVVLNQIYGGGGKGETPFTHSFIELYNPTDTAVNLAGWKITYSSNRGDGDPGDGNGEIGLTGSIPAHSSYLIRGAREETTVSKYEVASFDVNWSSRAIDNNDTMIIRLVNQGNVVVDAFSNRDGSIEEGTVCPKASKQKSYRRNNFVDTNDNGSDFEIIVWNDASVDATFIASYYPRSSSNGQWGLA